MLPVHAVTRPSDLDGQTNGWVAPDRLLSITTNGRVATLVRPAAKAWVALVAAAQRDGITLLPYSTYRSFDRQKALFLARYSTAYKANTDRKIWDGKTWYLHTGAVTAAPGTSNHGWGLAIDCRVRRGGLEYVLDHDDPAVRWLVANEERFGFSHEIQSEPWHIRYWAGDHPPITQPIPEDDMPLSPADLDAIGARVQAELKKGTGTGQLDWPSTNRAILGTIQSVSNAVNRLASQPPTNVNVGALAAEMVDLMDDDLAAAVANELARRLGD